MTKPAPVNFRNERHSGSVTLEFLTPMFGGGTRNREAGKGSQFKEADEVTPVRVASIRGQLRYWWRATSGAWCGTREEMKKRESELFGAASTPGDLSLRISTPAPLSISEESVYEVPQGKKYVRPIRGRTGVAYGAFPLSPSQEDRNANLSKPGTLNRVKGQFDLHWTSSGEFADEVKLAVDAWVAFGGLGGRTTRGFGQFASGKSLLDSVLTRVKAKGNPPIGKEIPALDPHQILHFKPSSNSRETELLNDALERLMTFRQGRNVARNRGDASPGRSRWPEPDSIRSITGDWAEKHEPEQKYSHIKKFPRAAFGLPIIFHFQNPTKKEPKDTSLQPVGKERMRSPLQIALTTEGTIIFAVLTAPRPNKVELKGLREVEHKLTEAERALLAERARDVFTDVDPLKAFLKFVQSSVDSRNIFIRPEF